MPEERPPQSSLKGRLADVYVPALVEGELDALARRLGNRATIDDPLGGRASTIASIEPLLEKVATYLREHAAKYRHRASTTGVDRDLCEGALELDGAMRALPVVVVAERGRLREIAIRVYYSPHDTSERAPRAALSFSPHSVQVPQLVEHVLDALRKGAVERVLAALEEGSRLVDKQGREHKKRDGAMSAFLAELGPGVEVAAAGTADDGRTCCVEAMLSLPHREPTPAVLAFERGDTGLLRELRLYYD